MTDLGLHHHLIKLYNYCGNSNLLMACKIIPNYSFFICILVSYHHVHFHNNKVVSSVTVDRNACLDSGVLKHDPKPLLTSSRCSSCRKQSLICWPYTFGSGYLHQYVLWTHCPAAVCETGAGKSSPSTINDAGCLTFQVITSVLDQLILTPTLSTVKPIYLLLHMFMRVKQQGKFMRKI